MNGNSRSSSPPKTVLETIDGVRYRNGGRLCNGKDDTCGAYALNGKTKCYYHGGPSRKGVDSPTAKHLRYSKDLPARLADRFEEAFFDDDLYDMRAEASVVQSRIGELIQRTGSGESGALWAELRELWPKFMEAFRCGDEDMDEQLRYIDQLIRQGASEHQAWEETMMTMDVKRKIGDSARRREMDLGVMVNAAQVTALAMAMADIFRGNVRKYVHDRAQWEPLLLDTSTEIDGLLYLDSSAAA